MKKISIITVSILLAGASAFAWSKKSENLGNLGRTYISVSGGVNVAKYENAAGQSASPTGAQGTAVINAPILKPGINAFRDIKWAGLDGNIFFNYDYSGALSNLGDAKLTSYSIGGQLTPYLNFETGLPFLKAIKPFGLGYAGYQWMNEDSDANGWASDNAFIYGVGAGVEFVLLDEISVTPFWKWNGNAQDDMPCNQEAGVEATYWITDQFCAAIFWTHNFGWGKAGTNRLLHGDIIGAKFKVGFLR